MKLYSYDHCPYCVKARMILGLKNIDFEMITLQNDDEDTPLSLIGKKMLPILVEVGRPALPESLDIIEYIDKSFEKRIVITKQEPFLTNWLSQSKELIYRLAMPRWPRTNIEEFQTESAKAYFIRKKELMIGSFDKALEKTPILIEELSQKLKVLENFFTQNKERWESDKISIDDFHLFARLRCLTVAKDVQLPPQTNDYLNILSERSGVPLHWNIAI